MCITTNRSMGCNSIHKKILKELKKRLLSLNWKYCHSKYMNYVYPLYPENLLLTSSSFIGITFQICKTSKNKDLNYY